MSEIKTKKRKSAHVTRHLVKIPPQVCPWLHTIGRIAEGLGVSAYAVGGCVRDWCLGSDRTNDLDITVEGDGIRLAKAIARRLRVPLTTHEQFGTATILLTPSVQRPRARAESLALRLDVATCRKEVYREPAAYPKVSRGTLRDDLFRRDFTINAMAMVLSSRQFRRLVDPFGGVRDLAAGKLRILHPRSFLDDPSRILRAIRFAHRFGFALEPATGEALRHAIVEGALLRLNRGRWRKELERFAEEPDPLGCLVRLGQWLSLPKTKPVT